MTASKFNAGDRVRVKNSRMVGTIVRTRSVNTDWERTDMCELELDSDDGGCGGLAFSFGESMLEHESPVESLAQVGREGRAGRAGRVL